MFGAGKYVRQTPDGFFRTDVEIALERLKRNKENHEEGPLSSCLAVVKEVDRLVDKFKINNHGDERYQFVICQLGPHYTRSLPLALEALKRETNTQCDWKCHRNLVSVMKYLDLQTDQSSAWVNKEAIDFCQQLLWSELDYLQFVKDFPVAGVGKKSLDIVEKLLCSLYKIPDCYCYLMCQRDVNAIKKRKNA